MASLTTELLLCPSQIAVRRYYNNVISSSTVEQPEKMKAFSSLEWLLYQRRMFLNRSLCTFNVEYLTAEYSGKNTAWGASQDSFAKARVKASISCAFKVLPSPLYDSHGDREITFASSSGESITWSSSNKGGKLSAGEQQPCEHKARRKLCFTKTMQYGLSSYIHIQPLKAFVITALWTFSPVTSLLQLQYRLVS